MHEVRGWGYAVGGRTLTSARVAWTRWGLDEIRVTLPIAGTRATVAYRLKRPTGVWGISGCYVGDLQLSDVTDGSVWEYAWMVGVATAPLSSYDYLGMGHGHETVGSQTVTVDGVDIAGRPVGATGTGLQVVLTQSVLRRLPLTAAGAVDDVTVIGTTTLTHTVTAGGITVAHAHTLDAGYAALNAHVAAQPAHRTHLTRFQVNDGPVRIPTESGATIDYGVQATRYQAWALTHPYRLVMTLPSGGPDVTGDWSHAGPDYGFFLDDSSRKFRVGYLGSTFAARINPGPTAHVTHYQVTVG